jgi:hypothetical protein
MPVVPFVLLVKVDSSILIDGIECDYIHRGCLRCVVHGTTIAKRQREVIHWSFDGFPEADSIRSQLEDL